MTNCGATQGNGRRRRPRTALAGQRAARREIAAEIDNFRAAWGWAVAQQQIAMLAPALESLRLFLEHAGWYAEAEAANQETKNRARQLLAELETQLPAPVIAAARERGRARKLEDVAADIPEWARTLTLRRRPHAAEA